MRFKKSATVVAASIAAIAFGSSPAVAAPGIDSGKGRIVSVQFVTTDVVECADGSVAERTIEGYFDGDEMLFYDNGNGKKWSHEFSAMSAYVIVHDPCTHTSTGLGGGRAHDYGAIQLADNARSATSRLTMETLEGGHDEYGTVAVDLSFVANSQPVNFTGQPTIIRQDGMTFTRNSEKVRGADVTGSIVLSDTRMPSLDGRNLLDGAQDVQATFGTTTYTRRAHG